VNTITGELQLSETYKNQLHKLQEEVTQKKHLVASVQSASNSKLSLYIDELGISTPQTILLSQFYYQPIVGIQKKDNPISFKKNQIIVKGISKENEDFSNWISLLEQKKWVKNISIHAYGKGKKTARIAVFKFIITTHD
jgi:Tfp pilus assembly protein PilN